MAVATGSTDYIRGYREKRGAIQRA